jgi:hypothetical protein
MVHIDCTKQPMEPRFVETWPGVHGELGGGPERSKR